jgi:hypothetical protein
LTSSWGGFIVNLTGTAAERLANLAPAGALLPDMLDREVHKKVTAAIEQ